MGGKSRTKTGRFKKRSAGGKKKKGIRLGKKVG